MNTSLLLIRHAETVWNQEGRMQGYQDSPLSETGTRQAEALGRRMRPFSFNAVYSSDSPRCVRTARIAMDSASAKITLKPELRERNLGEWEGALWREIATADPESARLYKQSRDFRPPNGETFLDLQERVMSTLVEISANHPGGRVAIFSSGGPIRAAVFGTIKLPGDQWSSFSAWNTGITRLDLRDGAWKVVTVNDVGHLPGTGDGRAAF